jgi:hypothetical protein
MRQWPFERKYFKVPTVVGRQDVTESCEMTKRIKCTSNDNLALDCTLQRTHFGRGYGPVTRQTI